MALIAFIMLAAPRALGVNSEETLLAITLRSALHIIVAYPLLTVGAHIAMTGLPHNFPLIFRALAGCLLAVPIIALISPVAAWSFDVMPAHIYQGPERDDLLKAIRLNYWKICIGYATLGVGIWLFLNFEWWRRRLGAPASMRRPEQAQRKSPQPSAESEAPRAGVYAGPAFVRRLSPEKRGELWALTAEQHYLRVYTNKGDDLILMRFSDAIGELEPADGLQVHRSHWVARIGVERLEEDGGKLFVSLRNGVKIPISRPNIAAAKLMFEASEDGANRPAGTADKSDAAAKAMKGRPA